MKIQIYFENKHHSYQIVLTSGLVQAHFLLGIQVIRRKIPYIYWECRAVSLPRF